MQNSLPFLSPESLGLNAALLLAVGVLWRALLRKDQQCDVMIRETLKLSGAITNLSLALDRLRLEGCGELAKFSGRGRVLMMPPPSSEPPDAA